MRASFTLLIAAGALAAAGCVRNTNVTLEQLAASQQTYIGKHVLTRGVVHHERDPGGGSTYFVLTGPHGALVGLEPAGTARRFEGRLVQVTGLFDVQPGFGRVIHIATIAPAKGGGG